MKRFYSVILLLSFLVGTVQPILPMIEYQLFESNINEPIAHTEENGEKSVETIAVTTSNHTSSHHADTGKSLLNDSYYPLGIDTAVVPLIKIFPHISQLYLPNNQSFESPAFIPNPPPPKVA